MRNKYFVGLILFLFMPLIGYAQTDISFPKVLEMSPNAASIAQYQDCPVSYYSGTPEISIPLYEIDVDGFNLPITLSYHASGIRVAQEASWVGLGWALNVGATISRTVKDFDDFLNWADCDTDEDGQIPSTCIDDDHRYAHKGFYYAPKLAYRLCNDNLYYPNTYKTLFSAQHVKKNTYTYFLSRIYHVYDNEPDIFNYSFPSFSGKFMFDNDKRTILLNKDHNLIFEPFLEDWKTTFFTVTDGNGNKYIFKDVERTQNYHQKGELNKNGTELYRLKYDNNPNNFISSEYLPPLSENDVEDFYATWAQRAHKYVSCWCLSEIITNKNRHIYFTYEKEDQYLPTQESCERMVISGSGEGTADEGLSSYYQSKTVNEALRLKRIDCDFCHIVFSASNRLDIKTSKTYPSKKLDCISIYNSENKHIKDITFDYDYFNSEKAGTDYDYVFMRLKLKSILDSSIGLPHIFSYHEDNSMPAKNSKNTDFWGYYNGRDYGAEYNVAAVVNGVYQKGVNKAANPKYTATYALNKIKYPTGGSETFEYETHDIGSSLWVPADPGLDGYPIQTDYSIHLGTYHNTGINEHEDWPASDTLTFEVKSPVRLAITCQIGNAGSDNKDPYFNYSYWFGEIQRENGSHVCWLWDEYPPTSYALNYEKKNDEPVWTVVKELDSGIYKFCTGNLPAEAYAEWKIDDGAHCSKIEILQKNQDANQQEGLTSRADDESSSAHYGGGLRIKAIQTDMKKRTFSYTTGKVLVQPIFTYWRTYRQFHIANYLSSESLTYMSTFNNGNSVGYDCVTEIIEDDDCPAYTKYYYKNDGEYELQDDNFPRGPVNVNYTDGLLEKKEVYYDDVLVKKNEYDYTSTYSQRIEALYDRSENYLPDEHTTYYYTVEWPKLSKETETIYDSNDENKKMVVTKTFTYNDHDLVSQETTNDGLSNYKNIIYYPFDFALQQPTYKQMAYNNIVSVPVEIVRLKDNAVIGATRANYQNINNMFLIKTHDELDLSVPTSLSDFRKYYSCKETFDYDENFGKLRQYSNSSGKLLTYLWGYNYQYPIATIENAKYSDVESLLGGADKVKVFLSKGGYEDVFEVLGFLGPIASGHLKNAYTNIYAYKPLVGMSSHMDVNGNLTHYYYDSKNRLWYVKDAQQKTIKKYNYNIKK